MAGVTVNIRQQLIKQFLSLYIFPMIATVAKMYNLQKCNTIPPQLLTVTLEKILNFFHFVLDFMNEKVYTMPVNHKGS